ncbi:hypothetical protein BZG02_00565 [Labilibaculum filiforme]|uniref:Pectate lyase superfamily protein domain-containing protein n=1 Tax=Labilibaculum filiforme TaxID=1940526 RepID=A0A2N3I5K7_9BACT|nr:hypothetical protein [Labilibaculum filiforme]PKQ65533.1 hypothetical protein BZG02_00565 [Labilibaculum filiforme]
MKHLKIIFSIPLILSFCFLLLNCSDKNELLADDYILESNLTSDSILGNKSTIPEFLLKACIESLSVKWNAVNTNGVDSYNANTMQGITKNRNSLDLTNKIPHTQNDVYDFAADFNASTNSNTDQSSKLQTALDFISGFKNSNKHGGILIIPRGEYFIKEINLRSNIMIACRPGAVFKPYTAGGSKNKITMFNLGDKRNNKIENVGIRGIEGGRARIDIPTWETGITSISLSKVEHFIISDINFYDHKTQYCCIGFSPADPADHTDFPRPTDGYVGNLSSFNCHFGYGLMQLQTARKIHAENCYSKGGVCYRLETGWNLMNQYSNFNEGGIFDITGHNLKCENGAAAVMISPHSQQCEGTICIEKVNAVSCQEGIQVHAGFVYKETKNGTKVYAKGYDSSGNLTVTLTPGHFNSQSFVRNVDVTFGDNAQCRYWPEFAKCMPDEYFNKITVDKINGAYPEYIANIPSIAPVDISSEDVDPNFEGYGYSIDWSKTTINHHGFKYNNGNTIETMTIKRVR